MTKLRRKQFANVWIGRVLCALTFASFALYRLLHMHIFWWFVVIAGTACGIHAVVYWSWDIIVKWRRVRTLGVRMGQAGESRKRGAA